MSDLTREEAIEEIKRWTPILLNSGQCTEETSEAQDMAISALTADGEYIKKADMEKILYSTNNAVRIGELFTELPTYSFPDSEKIGTCSKCGKDMQKLKSIKHGKYDFWYCPTCFADMRGKAE